MTPPILVFDLDGTLTDPFDGIWRSTNHALEGHGHPPVPRSSFHRFIGPPIDQTFATLVPGADAATIDSLVQRFRERYGRTGYAENVLYPRITELLERLTSAGFTCGVCTAKRRDFACKVLDLFELTPFFAFTEGGDVGVRKADQLRSLLQREVIGPDAIMIGDRASDLEAAGANGLRGVGVAWGYGDDEELIGASPSAVASSPAALLELLVGHSRLPANN